MGFGDFFDEPKFDFNKEKKTFVDNLNLLKTMSVQEQTLYKKWMEFNADVYSMTQKAPHFSKIEKSIWTPKDINNKEQTIKEIEALEPYVEMTEQGNTKHNEEWTLVRRLIHTMEFTANPGRNVKFYVKDKVTKIKLKETINVLKKAKIGRVVSDNQVTAMMIAYELIQEIKNVKES